MSDKTTFSFEGHSFTLRYDLPLVRDIRRELDVDILTTDGVKRVASNLIDFAEYVFHSCKKQVETAGLTEGDFIRGITPIADEVSDCWLEAIALFFEQTKRSALARLARSLINADRAEREEANRLVDDKLASQITAAQTAASSAKRRQAIDELIGADGGADAAS